MRPVGYSRLAILGIAFGPLLIAGVFLWLRLTTPFDGARLEPAQPVWKENGVVVRPPEVQPDGLQEGDLVVAIDGQRLEFWAQTLVQPGIERPNWQFGQTVTYTVVRDGNRMDVPVTLTSYPLGAVLSKSWGVFIFLLAFQPVGLFVFLRRPYDHAARVFFLSASCVLAGGFAWSLGLQLSDLIGGVGFWLYRIPLRGAYMLSYVGQLHFALIFPTKSPFVVKHPSAVRLIYAGSLVLYGLSLGAARFAASSALRWLGWWTPSERGFTFVYFILTVIIAVKRYGSLKSDPISRNQIRWIVFALALSGGLSTCFGYLPEIFLGHPLVNWNTLVLFFVPLPLSFAVAILRYRLFDIDILINRTLVYGTLTALVIAIYMLVVGTLSVLFEVQNNLPTALVATGIIAVIFQPLRERLQQSINRLMYGERDNPYAVLAQLGQRVEVALSPDVVLPTIVETVAHALKLPYVAIYLSQEDSLIPAAAYGLPQDDLVHLPLIYQREAVGELIVSSRSRGEILSPMDRRVLDDLAHQVSVAAHAVRLTADLQRSREQLVTAREEERRRLRRDLHDGLGPTLASLTLKLDAASNLLMQDLSTVGTLLTEASVQSQAVITDIRRLVYELRPPALDDLGLIAALETSIAHYHTIDGLHITVEAPDHLPSLPAAVEVAAYRIALEALHNVVRHAKAQTCMIRLFLSDALYLDVIDDGCGLSANYQAGVGLSSMRERATELGGTCTISPAGLAGTRVSIRLPLPRE